MNITNRQRHKLFFTVCAEEDETVLAPLADCCCSTLWPRVHSQQRCHHVVSVPLIRINGVDTRSVISSRRSCTWCLRCELIPPTDAASLQIFLLRLSACSAPDISFYFSLSAVCNVMCLWVHVNQLWFCTRFRNVYSSLKQNCLQVENVSRRRGADNLSSGSL